MPGGTTGTIDTQHKPPKHKAKWQEFMPTNIQALSRTHLDNGSKKLHYKQQRCCLSKLSQVDAWLSITPHPQGEAMK
eukprot:6436968-Amphidinium_carterae.1